MSVEHQNFLDKPLTRRQFLASATAISGIWFGFDAATLKFGESLQVTRINVLNDIRRRPLSTRSAEQSDAQLDSKIIIAKSQLNETTIQKRWKIGGLVLSLVTAASQFKTEIIKGSFRKHKLQPTMEEIHDSIIYSPHVLKQRMHQMQGGALPDTLDLVTLSEQSSHEVHFPDEESIRS